MGKKVFIISFLIIVFSSYGCRSNEITQNKIDSDKVDSLINVIKINVNLKSPDITFSDSMMLECGDTTFEMIYFGKFHSNSDILIYVPEIQTLFIGDLFTKYGRPSMSNSPMTDETKWIHAIKWTNKRIKDIRTIVDGHGQILTIDDLRRFNDNLLKRFSNEETK
jgi:flavorubredoxin